MIIHQFALLNKPHALVNGDRGAAEVQMFGQLDKTGKNLMRAAVQQMNLSARAHYRVPKLARTIADLAGEQMLQPPHLAETLQSSRGLDDTTTRPHDHATTRRFTE